VHSVTAPPPAAPAAPLVPAWLVLAAAVTAALATAVNLFAPSPYDWGSGIVAYVSALLAGIGARQLVFSRPLIPLALVPTAMAGAATLAVFAQVVPSPVAQLCMMTAAEALAGLAGKVLPTPTAKQ
jgi:hypothetical protein